MEPEEQTPEEISQETEPATTAAGSSREGGGVVAMPLNPTPPQ